MLTDTTNSPYARVTPLSSHVTWTGGFWKDAADVNAKRTVPHLQNMFESSSISHIVENFRICAAGKSDDFDGTDFGDGDFYKWMEEMCIRDRSSTLAKTPSRASISAAFTDADTISPHAMTVRSLP